MQLASGYLTQRKGIAMLAWHYTTAQKYKLIKESGLLLPATIGVLPPERPILWFSTHPKYEPTALKPLGDGRGNIIRLLTMEELYAMAGGLVRFGCPVTSLKHGEDLRKTAKMSSIMWRRLQKSGRNQKANPCDWWGHVGSMTLDEVTVQVMDAEMTWRPLRG